MIRKLSLLAAAGLLAMPLSASALGLSITSVSSSSGNTSLLYTGDVLTVELSVENSGGVALSAAGIAVGGYDLNANGIADDPLAVTGGDIASSMFNQVANPFLGGLDNVLPGVKHVGSPGVPINGPGYVPPTLTHAVLFEGVSLTPTTGDGSLDPGVDGGVTGADGQAHFRVFLTVLASGLTSPQEITLDFGALEEFGQVFVDGAANVVPVSNASLTFSIVPEPGTALLLGLGLAGRATTRRR